MNSLFTRVCPALIIALALSACGSSGQTPSTSPTTTVPENGSKPAESKPVEPSGNTTADNKPAELSQNTSSENKENTTVETKPQPNDKPITPPVVIPPATPTQPTENTSKEISSIAVEYNKPRTYEFPPYIDNYGTGPREIGKSDNLYTLVVDGEKSNYCPTMPCLEEK